MKKKKQAKTAPDAPVYKIHQLRMTEAEFDEMEHAAKQDSKAREIPYSRNNFCLRAVLASARKV